jgi:hypothetical protein
MVPGWQGWRRCPRCWHWAQAAMMRHPSVMAAVTADGLSSEGRQFGSPRPASLLRRWPTASLSSSRPGPERRARALRRVAPLRNAGASGFAAAWDGRLGASGWNAGQAQEVPPAREHRQGRHRIPCRNGPSSCLAARTPDTDSDPAPRPPFAARILRCVICRSRVFGLRSRPEPLQSQRAPSALLLASDGKQGP